MNVTRTAPLVQSIKTAFLNASSIGSTQVLAAAPGMSIRVINVAVVASGINSVKFLSATTDISATFAFAANGGVVLPFNEHGWFQTNAGEALNVNLTAANAVGIQISYIIL